MHNLNVHKTGLVFGSFFGILHLVWAIIVGVGMGQVAMDFVLKLHMIHTTDMVSNFSIGSSITLVIFTAVVGYIAGYIFALLWNKLQR